MIKEAINEDAGIVDALEGNGSVLSAEELVGFGDTDLLEGRGLGAGRLLCRHELLDGWLERSVHHVLGGFVDLNRAMDGILTRR